MKTLWLGLIWMMGCGETLDLQIVDAEAIRQDDNTVDVSLAISHEGQSGEWLTGSELCVDVSFMDAAEELIVWGESCSDEGLQPGDRVEHMVNSGVVIEPGQDGRIDVNFHAVDADNRFVGDQAELPIP